MKTAVLLMVACAPAALRWWWARGVLRDLDDPALPERLLVNARRNSVAVTVALAVVIALSPRAAAWTVPLLFLARLVVGYPIRRKLFDETWSLTAYLSCFLRGSAAFFGPWILLALLPVLARQAGTFDWLAGAALGAVLIAWNLRSSDVVLRALRTSPFSEPGLLLRFSAMTRAAGIPHVRFQRVDLRGGMVANAVALPSSSAPAVLFTEPLIARLSEAEIAAVCAHELAHLEFYNLARLRRMHAANAVLILSGAALAPALRGLGISSFLVPALFWYAAVIGVAAWRARDRQRNESSSDARAVALCGDPEALVRGLTKLYTVGRVPRRLDPRCERQATHPSLARRIRDIRRTAGAEAPSLGEEARFTARDGATTVTFAADRLHWSEGEGATHTLTYSHLAELRVLATARGASSLTVVECGGRRWTMPLGSADVARAQSVLDLIDGRLAEPPPQSPVSSRVTPIVTAFAALVAILAGQITAAILAAVVTFKPSRPLLAAAGVGIIAGAALDVRLHGVGGANAALGLLLATLGVVLLAVTRRIREETPDTGGRMVLVALGAAALLAFGVIAIDGFNPIRLHRSAQAAGPAVILSIALAGALVLSRERGARYGALGAAALAATVTLLASTWFLDRFSRDPLLVRALPVSWRTFDARFISRFDVPYIASTLRLSPGGTSMAIREEDEEEAAPPFHVGRLGGELVKVAADDLAFIDDDRVLLMASNHDALELRELEIAAPGQPRWQARLPLIAGAQLSVPAPGVWRVLGSNRSREIVRLEGQIGSSQVNQTKWSGTARDAYIAAIATAGSRALVLESRYKPHPLQGVRVAGWMVPLPLAAPEPTSQLRWIDADGRARVRASDFAAQCVADADGGLICAVFDGTDSRMAAIDTRGEVAPIASLPGHVYLRGSAGPGWVTCWSQCAAIAFRPATREALRLRAPTGESIADMRGDGRLIATTLFNGNGGTTVRLYERSE